MASRHPRRALIAVAAPLAVASLALSACGSNSPSGSSAPGGSTAPAAPSSASSGGASPSGSLAALVPASVKADGKIVVGSDSTYAPNEFIDTDGKTVIGMDVDLGKAIGQQLGLQVEFVSAPFDAILPGLASGKYEMGMSSFTVNPDREKTALMITYFNAGTSWAVQKGNPDNITPDTACGKKVAVQKATVQVDDVTKRSKTCTDAGKPAITIDQYAAQTDATTAVVTGKDSAMLADSPVVAYAIKQTGDKLETTGQIYDAAPYGIAVPKDETGFADALQKAVQAIIDNGEYQKILQKWGTESGAIKTSEINPKVS